MTDEQKNMTREQARAIWREVELILADCRAKGLIK